MLQSVTNRIGELNLLRRILASEEPVHWSDVADLLRWATVARAEEAAVRSLVDRLVRRKRIILCLSSGRSGTGTLRRIFSCLDGIDCHHEPQPNFVRFMRMSQLWPKAGYHFLVQAKLPAIDAMSQPVYVETSHLVCKGFLEPMFALGLRPDLIVLHRDARKVARSMIRLGTVPGRTLTGLTWYVHPGDPGVLPFPNWRDASDYQLAFWYALETERRRQIYTRRGEALGCRVAAANIEDLNTLPAIVHLWQQLDLSASGDALKRVNKIIGKRFNRKEDEGVPDSYSDAALEVEEAAVLEETGFRLREPIGTPATAMA